MATVHPNPLSIPASRRTFRLTPFGRRRGRMAIIFRPLVGSDERPPQTSTHPVRIVTREGVPARWGAPTRAESQRLEATITAIALGVGLVLGVARVGTTAQPHRSGRSTPLTSRTVDGRVDWRTTMLQSCLLGNPADGVGKGMEPSRSLGRSE